MGSQRSKALLLQLAALVAPACGAAPASHDEALAADTKWYEDRATDWTLTVDDAAPAHAFTRSDPAAPCADGSLSLRYAAGGYDVTLAFSCAGRPIANVDQLQSAFAFASVGAVPAEVSLPGWRFQAYALDPIPIGNVLFPAWDGGRVTAELAAVPIRLSATQTKEACGATHEPVSSDCYVLALRTVMLHLTLTAALPPSALE